MPLSKVPLRVAGDPAAGDLTAARRVLTTAAEALSGLAAQLDGDFTRAVGLMVAAKGRIIVSGMGKSGHIARKIAATLSSTGTPAYFVHPAEASHGDHGRDHPRRCAAAAVLGRGDGGAGRSDHLCQTSSHCLDRHRPAMAESTLMQRRRCEACSCRDAPEACPMGMAPTTSTTMMLSLGDALAVALMERKGFSPDQYRDFHPGGSLGRALIRVSDLMHSGDAVPLARTDTPMRDVLLAMASGRLGCVGIVDGAGALVGIVTDGDIRRHMLPTNPRTASKAARPAMS